jgi:hypothetical protein
MMASANVMVWLGAFERAPPAGWRGLDGQCGGVVVILT